MTATKTLEVLEFACIMAREFPDNWLPGKLEDLMKLARRHCRLMERDCNTGDVSEKTIEKLRNRIKILCLEIGDLRAIFGGDPRGATVKLKAPSGRTNDFAAEGVCVPGS